jgi:hypothetical protein
MMASKLMLLVVLPMAETLRVENIFTPGQGCGIGNEIKTVHKWKNEMTLAGCSLVMVLRNSTDVKGLTQDELMLISNQTCATFATTTGKVIKAFVNLVSTWMVAHLRRIKCCCVRLQNKHSQIKASVILFMNEFDTMNIYSQQ